MNRRTSRDQRVFGLASIAMLFVAMSIAACCWPALRAACLDPVHARRSE